MFFLKIWCLIILISKIFLTICIFIFTFLATVIRLLHFLHCGTTVSIKSHTFIMNWTFEYYFCSVNALITQNVLSTRAVLSYWILWHIMADSWWKCEGWSDKQESYEKAVTWQVRSLINTTDALNRRNSVTANEKRVDEKRLMLDKVKIISPMFDQVLQRLQRLPQQLRKLNLTCTLINTTQKGTNSLFHPHSSMHAKELYTVHTRSKP